MLADEGDGVALHIFAENGLDALYAGGREDVLRAFRVGSRDANLRAQDVGARAEKTESGAGDGFDADEILGAEMGFADARGQFHAQGRVRPSAGG